VIVPRAVVLTPPDPVGVVVPAGRVRGGQSTAHVPVQVVLPFPSGV
jgi:hypothetical protein